MQHNVQTAIFHMAQYSVCGPVGQCIRSAPSVRCAAYFPRLLFLAHTVLSSVHTVARHNIMRYARQNGNVQNCTHLPLFGVMFQ